MSTCRELYVYISLLTIIFTGGYSVAEAPSTLRFAHVMFRHGDRSPTQTFPNDPHQANSWPQGFGQLTQLGMRQEYQLGKVLRSLYNGLLNNTYLRNEIYVRSTDKDRTLMSAYTCLAGLYPPRGEQVWNSSILWQPIPVHTVNFATDNLLNPAVNCDPYMPMMYAAFDSEEVHQYIDQNQLLLLSIDCPRYQRMLNETANSSEALHYEAENKLLSESDTMCKRYALMLDELYASELVLSYEGQNQLLSVTDTACKRYDRMLTEVYRSDLVLSYESQNQEFLDMVRKESGLGEHASLYDIMEKVPNPLLCEKLHNLTLPQWVTPEVFDKLQDMKNFQIKLWFYTPEMVKIRAGVFLSELVNHTRAIVAGQLQSTTKMFLYSAHDTSLAAVLIALDTWDGLLPAYSSLMTFELHQRADDSYFVRLLYKNDSTIDPSSEPVTLSIRGCELDCDLEKFYKAVQPMVYEGDWFKDCGNIPTVPMHSTGTLAVVIAVCVVLLILVIMIVTCVCYKKKSGGIAYQSANFSADTTSA